MGMIIYKRKSIEYFDRVGITNPHYQSVVCQLPYGIVCFIYINPKINNSRLNDLIKILNCYSIEVWGTLHTSFWLLWRAGGAFWALLGAFGPLLSDKRYQTKHTQFSVNLGHYVFQGSWF